ncbi:MAG: hypothetical protein M3066_01005 [Actinomycetota bacterium]|nr:hypothetical protein [Actinomycetota bacterium]
MEFQPRTIGRPNREREVAGAAVLLAGALVVAVMAALGQPAYHDLLALGSVAVLAWLVDGSSRRYLGPGLVAVAAGLGITIGKDFGVNPYEHSLVYGGFGVALLVVSYFNPMAMRASGAFLIYVGVTVALAAWVFTSFPLGWELAAILAVWGAFELVRLSRTESDSPSFQDKPATSDPVLSGRR